jgi:hypothetical protein
MLRRSRRCLTFANVTSTLALVIALGTGTAYAANTVFSTDIVDGEVKTVDLGSTAVTTPKLHDNAVKSLKIDADAINGSKVLDGSIAGADIANNSLTGSDVLDGSLTGADIANNSITGSDILLGSILSTDIADHAITMTDIDGTSRHGAISVSAISNDRCVTITGNVSGAEAGDAVVLTTDGSIPSGMLIYGQRALEDQVQIKVCNLSGATSAAINDLGVRVITIH